MNDELKLLILDFDGVIVESVGIKTNAFRRLFAEYPEEVDEIVGFHLENDGLSRFKKFDHIFAEILRRPLDDATSIDLGKRFSELVVEEIKSCPFVPGAEEFLKKYHKLMPVYVASGTPEEELLEIVEVRGLAPYFKGVYGSPSSKSEISRKILAGEGVKASEALFIGDTLTDCTEAAKAGVPFIARWDDTLPITNPFDTGAKIVRDLFELDELIGDRFGPVDNASR